MSKCNGVVKQIFKDHFHEFWQKQQNKFPEEMQEHLCKEVMKMLNCGEFALGFVAYICMECLEKIKIGFSCKSRFCNRCGKKYISDWVEKQVTRIVYAPHRHCVFTIPKEFRSYFFWHRKCLKDLQDMAYEVIEEYVNEVNGKNRTAFNKKKKSKKGGVLWQCGMIGVVHTFGRDISFNPHIHALVPELRRKGNRITKLPYFEYKYLRKAWQYKLITYMISKKPEMKVEYGGLFKVYSDGFYVHAEPRMKDPRECARYIGRYLARPAIAEYRIVSYDGNNVHFWYIDHQTEKRADVTITAEEFIGKLMMHIPPKSFKMVRRYGIYAGNIQQKVRKCFSLIRYINSSYKFKQVTFKECYEIKDKKITWRQMIIDNFSRDPLQCKNCGSKMELFEIWHPEYGYIFEYGR